ncbi:MAG: indoleamine 2,3-dioxygenase [Rickettsiales bacterium]|nr:indoleamine 2,3-dioxygenase [Rickettsiales bacterium]
MLSLKDFNMSEDRGFLTPYNMGEVTLPTVFNPILEAGKHLSDYMSTGRLRHFLNQLPEIDMAAELPSLDDAQRRMLMVHYSFIIQAYIWGDGEATQTLPRNLAVPYCALSDAMEQFPLLPYSAYTLDNWGFLNKNEGVGLDNVYVIQNFLDGVDENWFILVHVEIEAKAGKALGAIPELLESLKQEDEATIEKQLETILNSWKQVNPVFDRMPEWCDPYIYYNRVRPYIHGWKGNPALQTAKGEGVIYEGVDKFEGKPQAFRGQTGSQSSIVPTMDALFQINHEDDPLRYYLDELHHYRPVGHRRFIEAVQQQSTLRDFVIKKQNNQLIELYNGCVEQVQNFRTRHLEYAASYINKQSRDRDGNPTDIGTGGTPFMKYLKKHRDESTKHLLPKAA